MASTEHGTHSTSRTPVIEAHSLCKSFSSRVHGGRVEAVNGIDLAVAPGETFGLVGPDGAGKTTTIRLLNGLLVPDAGQATVMGYDVVRHSLQVHERVGYMAQQFSLYGDLSVDENIRFFANVYGVGRAVRGERIARLLEFARLSPFRARPAGKLSGGMKKKLALACMLVHEPALVFLDEPTTGVDPVSRREFWDLLTGLRLERGLTILVSTPYMDEAERCHRVGLMYGGRLIATGTPAEIKALVPGQLLELRPTHWAQQCLQGQKGLGAHWAQQCLQGQKGLGAHWAQQCPQGQKGLGAPWAQQCPQGQKGLGAPWAQQCPQGQKGLGAPWAAAKGLLAGVAGVLEVQTYGDRLHVYVDDAAARAPQLVAALAAQGIGCGEPRPIAPRLEDAFVSLVHRHIQEAHR